MLLAAFPVLWSHSSDAGPTRACSQSGDRGAPVGAGGPALCFTGGEGRSAASSASFCPLSGDPPAPSLLLQVPCCARRRNPIPKHLISFPNVGAPHSLPRFARFCDLRVMLSWVASSSLFSGSKMISANKCPWAQRSLCSPESRNYQGVSNCSVFKGVFKTGYILF